MRAPTPRSVLAALGITMAAWFIFAVSGAAQTDSTDNVIPSQDGWWYRLQGPQEGEPANPARPLLAPVPLAQSTVPANGLGVGAASGESDKVAAIGLILDAPVDAFVDSFVLTLKETAQNGSNLNAAQARINACPITSYWAGVPNGDWQSRPQCDAATAAPGERAPDGTWTFDLTTMAQLWVDGTTPQNGVLLVETVDAPQSFQVSLENIASGSVRATMTTTGGGFSGSSSYLDDFGLTTATSEPAEATRTPVASPPFTTGDTVARVPTATTIAPESPVAVRRPPLPTTATGGDVWGDLPAGAVIWVPLALALGLGLAYILGPAGRPAPDRRRTGGVARVLAARDVATR